MKDDTVCNELSGDLLQFNLDEKDESSLEDPFSGNIPQCASNSLEQESIILQPNSVLERHLVSNQNRYKHRLFSGLILQFIGSQTLLFTVRLC